MRQTESRRGYGMNKYQRSAARLTRRLEPTWEIAHLFPYQGAWCEDEYLALETNRLVELSEGHIEVLPMPTMVHQLILAYLHGLLKAFVTAHDLGTTLFAAFRVRLWQNTFREPDIIFMLKEHADRIGNEYWDGADLVMEVVSGTRKDRRRDLVTKRREYARAGIPEYWIVDPKKETIIVLRLSGNCYIVHGTFGQGETATSHLLQGFTVAVTDVFSQRSPKPARKAKKPRKRKQ